MLCLFVGFRIVYDSPCIIEVMRSTWNAPQTIHLAEIECGRRKKWINERITRLENPTILIYHIVTIPSHNWICTLQRTLRINLHNHLFAFPRFFPRMTPKCVVAGSESRLPLQQPCKGDASSRWFNCPGRGVFPKDIGRVPLPSVCWFELAWWSCPISCSRLQARSTSSECNCHFLSLRGLLLGGRSGWWRWWQTATVHNLSPRNKYLPTDRLFAYYLFDQIKIDPEPQPSTD